MVTMISWIYFDTPDTEFIYGSTDILLPTGGKWVDRHDVVCIFFTCNGFMKLYIPFKWIFVKDGIDAGNYKCSYPVFDTMGFNT